VDVQPSHPGSCSYSREFEFLFFKNKIVVGASPTAFPLKKIKNDMLLHIHRFPKKSVDFVKSWIDNLP
jgi:hypothetical protein